ncbi:Hypothetical Protein FCC1311_104002 [Hondaea fermentalgiana]|uniref:Glycoside-hydrolase family GH114 TIM-barrel domain-containing protein n=1 Tax=Hondaea fermentalgiana TaxID=2315210 RepID=A0A2R5GTH7_9STRA|nr:Hypothetical Protein FCC1311_104002 [Hondaea fermentalgiana]|eukprot:GBG34176.1 Hypothetical Protein FCC1311_104002 [Hondaea fermentalgiana]
MEARRAHGPSRAVAKTRAGAWFALAVVMALVSHCHAARHVRLPKTTTWANLAWGFKNGAKDETVDGRKLVLVDLFDETIDGEPAADKMAQLIEEDHIVMCYMSAGTAEDWRPDFDDFKPLSMSQSNNWPSEFYLDISQTDALLALMQNRLELAAAKGCHVIEPDNVDCFDNQECYGGLSNDFDSSLYKNKAAYAKALQITYLKGLATAAHNLGLSIVLKNAASIVPDIESYFDGVLTENCAKWDECDAFAVFPNTNRAHFDTEYVSDSLEAAAKRACSQEAVLQSKYCQSNKGEWLCTRGEQWKSCSSPESTLPATEWVEDDGGQEDDDGGEQQEDPSQPPSTPAPTLAPTPAPTRAYPSCPRKFSRGTANPMDVVFVLENMNGGGKGVTSSDFAAIKAATARLALGVTESLFDTLDDPSSINFALVDAFKAAPATTTLAPLSDFLSALEDLSYRGKNSGNKATLYMDKALTQAVSTFSTDDTTHRRVIAVFTKNINGATSNRESFVQAVAEAEAAGISVILFPVDAEKSTLKSFKAEDIRKTVPVIKAKKLDMLDSNKWERKAMNKGLCPASA